MNECALVSIVIPAYKPEFFATTLASALNQSWPNCEVIIYDDSNDDTIRLTCERYALTTKTPIYYTKNSVRLWEEGNVLAGVRRASGKYIKFLYDDDIIFEHCITRLVSALESSPNNRIASSRRVRIDENGTPLVDIAATAFPFTGDVILDGPDVVKFFTDHPVNFIGEPSTVLCYREDLLSFDEEIFKLKGENLYFLTDMTLYLKLLRLGNLAFIAETLAAFRVSENQSSQFVHTEKYGGLVNKTYTRLPQIIRELGWYSGNKEENEKVKVALMHGEQRFQTENLLHALHNSLQVSVRRFYSNKINKWLDERRLQPQFVPLVEAFQQARNTQQTLTVFISQYGHHPDAITATLQSLQRYAGFGLTLNPVIITDQRADLPAPTLIARQDNQIDIINHYIASQSADWVMFLEAGEVLLESGMLMFDLALDGASGCDAIYGDEFYAENGEIVTTAMRPDFNLDLLLSYPAEMARHWIFRSATLLAAGGFNPAYQQAWQFEFIVRLIEQKGMGFAGHLPEPFVIGHPPVQASQPEEQAILTRHLHNRGYAQGTVVTTHPGLYALRYNHQQQPLVSIIIPTKDQLTILSTCVTSLLEKTRYRNYELLIVDNNSETPEALQWLEGISTIDPERIRVLRYPHPFNYSAINNMAAQEARGEYLVLLNNDTAVISENWLDHMLNHGLRPEVGITGAKLLYPDGKVQHAGVVLGLRGPADHPFIGSENNRAGYMNRLLVDQNYNVVTAACLLIRKSVYEQVGGLDEENFTVSYNDVDLCLKVREAGYLTVWTPHALVMHEGSVSQKKVDKTVQEKKRQRFMAEQDTMYAKWMPLIANDPAYNPNLLLDGAGFQFEASSNKSWQPLHWKPLPRLIAFPLQSQPGSRLRLDAPLSLLNNAGVVEGQINYHASTYIDISRFAPDALIVHRQISDGAQEWLRRLPQAASVFKIFDLDCWLPGLPVNADERNGLPQDIFAALRGTLAHVDRLIVASNELAEQCAGLHRDIRVMPTLLSPQQWSGLSSQRGVGKKPRIGWCGTAASTGDLELIHKLVSQLADRVEWVFYGYCPPSLREWVSEFHAPVYPQYFAKKLASLNLDLAVEPLADTPWNRALSPVRLLEYGACGVPVICSDIISTQGIAGVTRVENRAKSWREAIENHLLDTAVTAQLGDNLRLYVLENGMWDGESLLRQAQLWLPD
ncbi:glycosyltransferase [Kosakonia oryziphila]|uniref:Glycosyltransferase, GT2 family n=1 Tax=Kosakonia oryziphila TaxID=1005667 RepID=A0A1C4GEJ3_9ENTR|nr:glycosyltransferase [Kosakonia oryziphila]SCC66642.1 Glycosyltransferase, GT2 family [Kosakonia oryziphila]